MSDYGAGNFMELVSNWAPLPSPTVREMFAMLDQTDNGLNPISDVFLQTNQSEQRSSLVDRVSARVGRKIPPLRTENITPFAALFRNPTTVPLVNEISPGISPSVLLQSPNNFSYSSSQPIPPFSLPNGGPPETVENAGDDHATTMIFNNNVPYQPMQFAQPPQEGSYVIPTENSVYIPSHESHVDPIGASLVPSFESEVIDDTDIIKLMSMEDRSKSEDEDKEYSEDEDTDTDEDSADELEVKPSSPKRRKYEISNMMAATRATKDRRFTLCVKTEEDHPSDGYRWRKYGQKVVKGNPNPRSYYRCTHIGCNVKKHVERGAADVKILLTTYTGKHGHPKPATRSSSSSGPKNRSPSSVPARLGRPPFSSSSAAQDMRPFPYPSASAAQDMRPYPHPYASAAQDMRPYPFPYASAAQDIRPYPYPYASAPQDMRPFTYPAALAPHDMRPFPSSLNQRVDMTYLYMSGLSKLPSFPVNNQNQGFMGQNGEPKADHVIPDGTGVYKEIMHRLFS